MIRLFTTKSCALICAVVASVGLLAGCSSNTSNSCEAPFVAVDKATVAAGESIELHGTAFVSGCADLNDATSEYLQNLSIVLSSQSSEVVLDQVDAEDGDFLVTVTIPNDFAAGMATITVGELATAEVTIS